MNEDLYRGAGDPDAHGYPGDDRTLSAQEHAEYQQWLDEIERNGFDVPQRVKHSQGEVK